MKIGAKNQQGKEVDGMLHSFQNATIVKKELAQ